MRLTNLLYSVVVDGLPVIPASVPSPSVVDISTALEGIATVKISSLTTSVRSELMFDIQIAGTLTYEIITTQIQVALETAYADVLTGNT